MKILIVTSQYHRGAGYPRYSVELVRALARRGHAVTVLCRTHEASEVDVGLGISLESYTVRARRPLAVMATEPRAATEAIERWAPNHDVTISIGVPVRAPVVLIGLGTHLGWYRRSLSMTSPTQLRWWIERVRPFHRLMNATERSMLRGGWPTRIVVGHEQFAREYIDWFGVEPDRIDVVPMGVDLDTFGFDSRARSVLRAELGVGPDQRLLLNVAGRARQKGLDTLVAALRQLDGRDDWVMAFVGDGSTDAALSRTTQEWQRAGRVHLAGRVPDVAGWYSAADLVVFPSRYDPWGLVITESLAAGTPVVASSAAGASVAVRPGENGLIADPGDPDALAATIARALDGVAVEPDRDAIRASVEWLTFDEGAGRLEPVLERATAAGGSRR